MATQLVILLLLPLLLPSTNALLTAQHLAYAFLLNHTTTPLLPSATCGTNLGSDAIRLDTTAAQPNGALPVSPAFYFHDGQRCRRTTVHHAAYFLLLSAPPATSLPPSLTPLATTLAKAAGPTALVSATGAHLSDARDTALQPGPVRCGTHLVHAVLYIRTAVDLDVPDSASAKQRLRKGRLYAAVATDDAVCWYEGSTRAPEGPLPSADPATSDPTDADPPSATVAAAGEGGAETGVKGGGGPNVVGLAAGVGGVGALAALLAVVTGVVWWRARRAERRKGGEGDDAEGEDAEGEDGEGGEGGESGESDDLG